MNSDYIFGVSFEPIIHIINKLKQNYKWRGMMVLPVEIANAIFKSIMVIGLLAYVKKMIFPMMTLI